MRGYPNFNHQAFEAASEYFRNEGWEIRSPAEKDVEEGFDGNLDNFSMQKAMQWDLEAVLWATHIILLPGWGKSQGVAMESAVARATGKTPVLVWLDGPLGNQKVDDVAIVSWEEIDADFSYRVTLDLNRLLGISNAEHESMIATIDRPLSAEERSPLTKALGLVHGDRGGVYGHPIHDFTRTAKIWSGILGSEPTPEQVALCMIGVKISRLVNSPDHKDSVVDIAGYAETYHMIRERRDEEAAAAEINEIMSMAKDLDLPVGQFWSGLNDDEDG